MENLMTDSNEKFHTVTICGSMKFKKEMFELANKLTLEGFVVLLPNIFLEDAKENFSKETIEMLEEIHKHKIDMSELIYVVNINDYVGKSTRKEIVYAEEKGKKIYYLLPHQYPIPIGTEIFNKLKKCKDNIKSIECFDEDIFNQGKYAYITELGSYLYTSEIELL